MVKKGDSFMAKDKKCPEYLYRGMCIRYEDLKSFAFIGVDMELPYKPYKDEQGRETVFDGNEYGIYMSDNPKVAEHAYGNATNKGDGTYIEPRLEVGHHYIMIPSVGVCYKISTKNLDVRIPWISKELQGVYNNGWKGDEWITNKIPAENYEIEKINIGEDLLHNSQDIELGDLEHINENIIDILDKRKSRLELFAKDMEKIPMDKRREFTLDYIEVFREIYGENGFKYIKDSSEIDTSSKSGMMRYLMANVYENDNNDLSSLVYLQNIKETVEMYEKKGKDIDLIEYFINELSKDKINKQAFMDNNSQAGTNADTSAFDEKIAFKEKMLELIKQKEKDKRWD